MNRNTGKNARIALEDGTVVRGRSFGAEGSAFGEIVFNTSLTGYQEILTDPSYAGQVVVLTASQIGNYGICPEDDEADRTALQGLVVREHSRVTSNFRSVQDLSDWLVERGIVAIDEVDTRALTRRIREHGEMRVLVTTEENGSDAELVERVVASPGLRGRDLIREVTRSDTVVWTAGYESEFAPVDLLPPHPTTLRIVAIDCGIKRNILRSLVQAGFEVHVVPARTSAAEILALEPRGLFLSNGPGDPAAAPWLVDTVRNLVIDREMPTFGICLGHQVLAQVFGGTTYKMQFGHHGGNHPVRDVATGKIAITSQNHSFAVDAASLPDSVEISHVNLNDGTIEGLRHRHLPAWSIQHHPEAAPGPHDALDRFSVWRDFLLGESCSTR
ncbi:MAG: glutamine-hydrolyzing carbamoyl-phosphate synthase small subunit [Planctomycetes bacterium]|nr:glutamine-hydrolyzing carbamoyl-phosphate synthase small subunit [Planctomycetota bacterium]MCB9890470.1 glutamine-hydrolyzing carbamoyl-phosphate synthase small subunit [Planctomycetota bacterium]MCB9917711.1 glutamine-hydrolyzing carbamoyl-phosphate synthase small subunit [Planctomycetota bacterium]